MGNSTDASENKPNSAPESAFPCKYKSSGCKELVPSCADKVAHEADCESKPCQCPCALTRFCEWEGPLEQVVAHLQISHSTIGFRTGATCTLQLGGIFDNESRSWEFGLAYLNQHFLITVSKSPGGQFQSSVRLIGTQKQAEKIRACLKMSLVTGGRHVEWESAPISIFEPPETMDNPKTFTFGLDIAKLFAELDGDDGLNVLSIQVEISRKQDEEPNDDDSSSKPLVTLIPIPPAAATVHRFSNL